MTADRKAVKRNLMDLVECGYDNISYDDTRNVPEPAERRKRCIQTGITSTISATRNCGF